MYPFSAQAVKDGGEFIVYEVVVSLVGGMHFAVTVPRAPEVWTKLLVELFPWDVGVNVTGMEAIFGKYIFVTWHKEVPVAH